MMVGLFELAIVLCALPNGFFRQVSAQEVTISSSRSINLERRYNLTHARKGKQAVKEAINFLIGQENEASIQISDTTPTSSGVQRVKCVSKENCPLCTVSMTAIISEGTFEYLGDNALPPYPSKCWAQSIRYHVAPECEREEASRGVVPVYKWRWTLKSAQEGYCRMPDPSPPKAAAAYLTRISGDNRSEMTLKINKGNDSNSRSNLGQSGGSQKRKLNVLFLGLSFMGQPWQSLGCLYSDLVVGGAMSTDDSDGNLKLPILDVKKNNGVCSGYRKSKIPFYHPPELHSNYSLPVQHADSCSADHAYAVYGSSDPSLPDVKVCFVYTFNVQKNVKPGHPLPW